MVTWTLCTMLGHRPARDRVWDDGLTFRCRCKRCRAPMLRDIDGWRLFDPARDHDPRRRPHPEADIVTAAR